MKQRGKVYLVVFIILLSIMIFLGEVFVAFIGSRYQIIYSFPWIPVVLNGLILLFVGLLFSNLRLSTNKSRKIFWVGMFIFLILGTGVATQLPSMKENHESVYSLSPNHHSLFYLKKSGEKVTYYQSYYLFFARKREELPYRVSKIGNPVWLEEDVVAVTYMDQQNQKHIYMGTYGTRGSDYAYEYVTSLTRGTWQDKEKTISLTNHLGKIAIVSSTSATSFESNQGVQFGKSGLVLTNKNHAEYAYAIGKDNHFSDNGDTTPDKKDKLILVQPDLTNMKLKTLYFIQPE